MKMIASLVMGAMLLFACEAKSASLLSAKSVPNIYKEGIAILPISSTNEMMMYSTNILRQIVISIALEDPSGWIEYEGRMWTEYGVTGFAWSAKNSELSLGETVSQAIETWLQYNIDVLESFNPENPGETYFKVGVSCRASSPEYYPNYNVTSLFNSDKVFRLVRSGDGYTVPAEASKGDLIYWPKWWEQFDIIVPGLDWARIETPTEVLDTRDHPEIQYNYEGRLWNGNSRGVLNFPSRFVGTKTKGKVILQLESGAKQEFDLATGIPLPPKPLSISIKRDKGGATVTVEGTPTGSPVHLQGSTNLSSWEDVVDPVYDFDGTSTFHIDRNGLSGFFRAVFDKSLVRLSTSP